MRTYLRLLQRNQDGDVHNPRWRRPQRSHQGFRTWTRPDGLRAGTGRQEHRLKRFHYDLSQSQEGRADDRNLGFGLLRVLWVNMKWNLFWAVAERHHGAPWRRGAELLQRELHRLRAEAVREPAQGEAGAPRRRPPGPRLPSGEGEEDGEGGSGGRRKPQSQRRDRWMLSRQHDTTKRTNTSCWRSKWRQDIPEKPRKIQNTATPSWMFVFSNDTFDGTRLIKVTFGGFSN